MEGLELGTRLLDVITSFGQGSLHGDMLMGPIRWHSRNVERGDNIRRVDWDAGVPNNPYPAAPQKSAYQNVWRHRLKRRREAIHWEWFSWIVVAVVRQVPPYDSRKCHHRKLAIKFRRVAWMIIYALGEVSRFVEAIGTREVRDRTASFARGMWIFVGFGFHLGPEGHSLAFRWTLHGRDHSGKNGTCPWWDGKKGHGGFVGGILPGNHKLSKNG